MIEKKQIAQGLMCGIIRLDIDPNMNSGIVARIGENWFYFGGSTAEEYSNVDEYKADIPFDTVVEEIYSVLHEWQELDLEEFRDEAAYYEALLSEKLPRSQNRQVMAFMDHLRETYSFDATTQRMVEAITRFAMRQENNEKEIEVARTLLEPLNLQESDFAFFGQE